MWLAANAAMLAMSSASISRPSDDWLWYSADTSSAGRPSICALALMTASILGPLTAPGQIALTRILSGPSSIARVLVSPTTAHFDAEYALRPAMPSRPAAEERFTIEASVPCRSIGRACLMQKNWPWMFTSKVAFQAAVSSVSSGPVGPAMPALLTSTSRPPSSPLTVFMRWRTWSSSETSLTAAASPLARAFSTAPASMSVTKTVAPRSRNLLAMARPMPLAPAVTRTLFAVKSMNFPCLICAVESVSCGDALRLLRAALEHQGQQRPHRAHGHDEPQARELGARGILHEPHDVRTEEAAEQADGVDESDASREGGAAEAGGRVGEEDGLQGEEVERGEAETDHAEHRAAHGTDSESGDDPDHCAGDQEAGAFAVGGEAGHQQGAGGGEDPRDGGQQAD